MIKNKNITIVIAAVLALSLSACAGKPEKPQTGYWQQKAEYYSAGGVQYYRRQQYREALADFHRALQTWQRFNGVDGELDSRINLAKTCIALDQDDAAQMHLDEARALIDTHRLTGRRVHLDIMRASLAIRRKDTAAAQALLESYGDDESLPQDVRAALLINRLRIAFLQGQESDDLLAQLQNLAAADEKLQPRVLRFRAQQVQARQDFSQRDELFGRALQAYREYNDGMGVMATLGEWGDALAEQGAWQQARQKYQAQYKAAAAMKHAGRMHKALQSLLPVYGQLGETEKQAWAREQLREAEAAEEKQDGAEQGDTE